jgi:CubicO group peptidase (beta-lactamase class C family)
MGEKTMRNLPNVLALAPMLLLMAVPPATADDYPAGDRNTMWLDANIVGSYRHLGEIFESRPVLRQGEISELPRGEQIEFLNYDVGGKPQEFELYVIAARTTGLIVLKNGTIVYERYWYGADKRSLFTSMSIAKSITSTLVGFAIHDGLIKSVDDPISDYLPELKGTGYDGVPIKAILQMSSGVNFSEEYSNSSSDIIRMWDESLVYNVKPLTEFVRDIKRSGQPFAKFHYAGIEPVALGWLVSRVTGKTLSDYLSEKMWGPLGMEADANWVIDGQGAAPAEAAFCCFNATLRDYARFGLLMAQDGVWQGQQLLPEGWVAEATRPDKPQVQPGRLYPGYQMGYQYFWWTFPGEDHAFTGQGINGQFLYVNPKEHLVIVMTNVWRDSWDDKLEAHTYAIFDAFADKLRE